MFDFDALEEAEDSLLTDLLIYLPAYLPYFLPSFLPTRVRTYTGTYTHTYIRTYLRTYVRTYIHAHIHIYLLTFALYVLYSYTYLHTCTFVAAHLCTYVPIVHVPTIGWAWKHISYVVKHLPAVPLIVSVCLFVSDHTPNLPTNIIPAKIAWLKLSRKFPMDLGIPLLKIKITLQSNPLKSTMLVGGLGVLHSGNKTFACSPLKTNKKKDQTIKHCLQSP